MILIMLDIGFTTLSKVFLIITVNYMVTGVQLPMQQRLPILVSMYLVVCVPTKELAPFVLVKVVHWWELPWNAAVGTMLGVTCKMHKALRLSLWRHCYVIVIEKNIDLEKGDPVLFNNVLTYYDCVQKCRQTASCVAVTFYSKDYVQVRTHRTHHEPFF